MQHRRPGAADLAAVPTGRYQLGYQAVQSQLSGLSDGTTSDRSQQFVTGGLFRRVRSGVQFGVAWDMLRDDFQMEEDFHQLRYEISLKGQQRPGIRLLGRFAPERQDGRRDQLSSPWTNTSGLSAGSSARAAPCGSGAAPLTTAKASSAPNSSRRFNNRWSVNSGFNYLITDQPEGTLGAREESWNVGINLVWHYGFIAKKGNSNPFAPLFSTADNGWMFIDQTP